MDFFILSLLFSMREAEKEVSKNSVCAADAVLKVQLIPLRGLKNTQSFPRSHIIAKKIFYRRA